MEFKYSKIVSRDISEAVVNIYGSIGEQIDGNSLAAEINYLGKNYDQITFRINSIGGNLIQALSIIGAIVGSPAYTVAVVEGIAASSSGAIAMSCRKVKINDYGRLMLHSPYFIDEKGLERTDLTEDEKGTLKNMSGILGDILTRRGKSQAEIQEILKKDTWFSAREAVQNGFCDEVIDTGVAQMAAGLSTDKLVAFAAEKNSNIYKSMKKINALLKLGEEANEAEAYQAILNMQNRITALEAENGTLKTENEGLKNISATDLKAKVKDLIDGAVRDRKILESQRQHYTALGEGNFDATKAIVDAMPVLAKLGDTAGQAGELDKYKGKSWDELDRMQNALPEIRQKNPEEFKRLYKEKFGTEYGA